ncbi:MAG: universal stress protein [Phycisphaerales bacterium]
MDRLSSIIVGIDFTPNAATALRQAIRIAAWNRAKLLALHVIETLVVIELQTGLSTYVQEIHSGLVEEAKKEWGGFAKDAPGKEAVRFEVAVNNQLVEFEDRIRANKADLLILGTHGAGSSHHGTGTLASQCVRRAPARVLLVREDQPGPFKSVVACIDFSPTSRDALDNAVRVAIQDNAALHVVHVFQPPWTRFHYRASTEGTGPDFQKQYRDGLLHLLERFCAPARPDIAWTKPHFHLVEASSHGRGIIDFVRAQKADLVALGTRGKTNLRDLVMGSTAERVVREAPCSILAIKPVA